MATSTNSRDAYDYPRPLHDTIMAAGRAAALVIAEHAEEEYERESTSPGASRRRDTLSALARRVERKVIVEGLEFIDADDR